ncbi:MAG: type II toxin-antitoxin system RelE/ParE family toxin [Candidatus Omnitrophica bacterium]|jgi:phage-related protein|nr:type II toxin-antitoxin system RelE/ParE family toxin [Candidatus Omnitrophota bacterium]
MALYTSYYFRTGSGRAPVKEFIDSLDSKTQRKFFYALALLEEFGHKLPLPHAKYIGDEVFELRFNGIEGNIRVLYFFFHQDKIIFANGFIKKSNKLPLREKLITIERRREFLANQEKKE